MYMLTRNCFSFINFQNAYYILKIVCLINTIKLTIYNMQTVFTTCKLQLDQYHLQPMITNSVIQFTKWQFRDVAGMSNAIFCLTSGIVVQVHARGINKCNLENGVLGGGGRGDLDPDNGPAERGRHDRRDVN